MLPQESKPTLPNFEEIFLPKAPLIVVLAQIKFSSILLIQDQKNLAQFQEALREFYPGFQSIQGLFPVVDQATGLASLTPQPVWQFSDSEKKWKITLAVEFIAIETNSYTSRFEFIQKFKFVLDRLHDCFQPKLSTRVGIRYIDRLTNEALPKISSLVKPPLLGVFGSDLKPMVNSAISESVFSENGNQIYVRWGLLPANSTIDPLVIKPVKNTSWILDIDVSNSVPKTWSSDQLSAELDGLARTNYNFFRWAVTDDFIRFYEGKI